MLVLLFGSSVKILWFSASPFAYKDLSSPQFERIILHLGPYRTNISAMTSISWRLDGMGGCIPILLSIYENVLAELL